MNESYFITIQVTHVNDGFQNKYTITYAKDFTIAMWVAEPFSGFFKTNP